VGDWIDIRIHFVDGHIQKMLHPYNVYICKSLSSLGSGLEPHGPRQTGRDANSVKFLHCGNQHALSCACIRPELLYSLHTSCIGTRGFGFICLGFFFVLNSYIRQSESTLLSLSDLCGFVSIHLVLVHPAFQICLKFDI
jgi:hypothetical protein